jgi:hypothetical protein
VDARNSDFQKTTADLAAGSIPMMSPGCSASRAR